MTINMKQIKFRSKMPEIPAAIDAVRVAAPPLEERREGISRLAGRLGLGKLRELETENSRIWAGRDGDVEFFPASGAVWSRNLSASEAHPNELREWPDLAEASDGNGDMVFTLGKRSARAVASYAHEVVKEAGFDLAHVAAERAELIQVAQLSEEGEILSRGAGDATLKLNYALDGMPVIGPGAKTEIDLEPDPKSDAGVRTVGVFHVWRRPLERRKVEVGSAEAALAAGLLKDPDLNLAVKQGGRVTVDELQLGLMALPAPAHQTYLFPALAVAGRVDLPKGKLEYYRFGRYCHVATPKAYAAAEIYADYVARPN